MRDAFAIRVGLRKAAVLMVMVGLLITCCPVPSSAASGRRMGGSFFSSHKSSKSSWSSSSSRSSSSSWSSFSSRLRLSSPSWSWSSSSSWSSPKSSSSSSPSPPSSNSIPSPPSQSSTGTSPTYLKSSVSSASPSPSSAPPSGSTAWRLSKILMSLVSCAAILYYFFRPASTKTSVLVCQVGLLGMARSLQEELDQIARASDTSTPQGLKYILTETTLALLRNPDYWISAYSSVDVKRSIDAGEKRFNQLSIEERGKFDEETLVNVNNLKKQSSLSRKPSGFSNEYIVVTVLVAAEGVHKLPIINGSNDLKEALQKLGSIPSNKTMAVEVLWTPQDVNDTLTERELLEDYSLLRPL